MTTRVARIDIDALSSKKRAAQNHAFAAWKSSSFPLRNRRGAPSFLPPRSARSPFVNSLLNKLKGHHASLVGCQAVEGTPELITADSAGVVKVCWSMLRMCTTVCHCAHSLSTVETIVIITPYSQGLLIVLTSREMASVDGAADCITATVLATP